MNGMLPRSLSRAFSWTKAHQLYVLEFEEHRLAVPALLRTWDDDSFGRLADGVLEPFGSDAIRELSVVRTGIAAVSYSASELTFSGGSPILVETYVDYLSSGHKERPIDHPLFELRFLK